MKSAAAPTPCDVLVVGSGAGGLAAAVTARLLKLDVLLVEKAPVFGGTTAWSGGWLWIPCNAHARRAGSTDSIDDARRYLQAELGDAFDAAKVDAFLLHGPEMVDFFERETALRFIPGPATPDFHSQLPGAGVGRPVCAAPFDGRELGGLVAKLRPPLPELSVLGMAIAAGADLAHFMNATRKPASALHAVKRFARHGADMLRHRRGMHLVNGNALVARLLKSASTLGVRMWTDAAVSELDIAQGAVVGARIVTAEGRVRVVTRRAVVLACGGFPHDVARRRALFAHERSGREHGSAAPPPNTGDGLRLAESAGAAIVTTDQPAAWAPVSEVRHRDGRVGCFPHLVDRAKPGVIAVTAAGRRFVNEANSYHDFIAALLAVTPEGSDPVCWLVADHRTLRRYGLGFAKPFPFPAGVYRRMGYLQRGATPEALAGICGFDAAGFAATLDEYNRCARNGSDPAFGRGSTPFNRFGGDPGHAPNPCVAPIEVAPYYAVRILPGSLGTFAGIRTDANAQALTADGRAIAGLYAVGNDMASIMGGSYPGGGITLGPAMTFGYLAARHLAGATDPSGAGQPATETLARSAAPFNRTRA
ncbi:MAG: FAD-dependent oxidoreductase [Casimicrobiaceae bacterium]